MIRRSFSFIVILAALAGVSSCSNSEQSKTTVPAPETNNRAATVKNAPEQEANIEVKATEEPLVLKLAEEDKVKLMEPEKKNIVAETAISPLEGDRDSSELGEALSRVEVDLSEDAPIIGYKFQKRSQPSNLPPPEHTLDSETVSGSIKDGKLITD